jgi:hypothetical protein
MPRIGITFSKLADWRNRALAGATTLLKKRELDRRNAEIVRLKSKVEETSADNKLLNAKIVADEGKRPMRGVRIAFVAVAMLTSGFLGYSCSHQSPIAKFDPASPASIATTTPTPDLLSPAASGCGSRGGPGYRLNNGKCASWYQRRHRKH